MAFTPLHGNENYFVTGRISFYGFTQCIATRREDVGRQRPGFVAITNEGNPEMRVFDVGIIINVCDAQPLLIGLIEFFGVQYVSSHYRDAYVFAILILVLLLRPEGILGTATVEKV